MSRTRTVGWAAKRQRDRKREREGRQDRETDGQRKKETRAEEGNEHGQPSWFGKLVWWTLLMGSRRRHRIIFFRRF